MYNSPLVIFGRSSDFYQKIDISSLNDKNVIAQLEKARNMKSEESIKKCLTYMTNFSHDDLELSLDRYFDFYDQLKRELFGRYQSDLDESIYTCLKSCADLQEFLTSYLSGKKGEIRSDNSLSLISLSLNKGDNALSLLLIDLRNKFEKPSGGIVSYFEIVLLLTSLSQAENSSQITILCKALELAESSFDAIGEFKKIGNDFPKIITNLLLAANVVKSDHLFLNCLECLYYDNIYSPINNPLEGSQIYKDIYENSISNDLREWAASLLIKAYQNESNEEQLVNREYLPAILAFLCFYTPADSYDEIFFHSLNNAAAALSSDEKCNLAHILLSCCSEMQYIPLVELLLNIIPHWNQYHNPNSQQKMLSGKTRHVFDLLSFGIEEKSLLVINWCLECIESNEIYYLNRFFDDYSELLHYGLREEKYHNELVYSIKLNENDSPLVFQIPKAILMMRAPYLSNIPSSCSRDDLTYLLDFIAKPKKLEELNFQRLGRLCLLADKIGAVQFKRKAEGLYSSQPFHWDDVPLLLELYAVSFGKNRKELFSILLSQAILKYSSDPFKAMDLAVQMKETDPDLFVKISFYPIIIRVEKPEELIPKHISRWLFGFPKLLSWHLEALKNLAPEMEELDLVDCRLEANSLTMLRFLYPDLKGLTIRDDDNSIPNRKELSEFKKLKILEILSPSYMTLKACSPLLLERLLLREYSCSYQNIEELLQKRQKPYLFTMLQSLTIIADSFTLSPWYRDRVEARLFSECPDLQEIAWKNNSKAFVRIIRRSQALSKFKEDMDEESQLNEISFTTVIDQLSGLKTLRFLSGINDTKVAEIAKNCPDVEELDLSYNPITKASVLYLAQLKKLKNLILVKTKLFLSDVLDLTAKLPELKSLTIQLKKSDFYVEADHRIIIDQMALRKIEVTAIYPEQE